MANIGLKDAQALLKKAGQTIREQNEKIASLNEEIGGHEKKARARQIAAEMESKNLNEELSYDEKVAHLLRSDNLEVTEQAVKMASIQGDLFGEPSDTPARGNNPLDAFVSFVNGSDELD